MGNISIMPVIGNIRKRPDQRAGEEGACRIGERLSEYIHDNGIGRVMFIDRSARPAHMALRMAWKSKYPQERMPETYFTNPQGHYTADRFAWTINNEFRSTYTGLVADRDAPVLLFDTCMHNGRRMGAVMQTLERLKFRNVLWA